MKKGFTLIELLVVITILAVLAGAALPYVQNYVEESRVAKAKTDLEEIARAIAVYETREGDYTKLDVTDLTGRYLNKSPIDPWGSSYIVSPDDGTVYSKGPDRDDSGNGKFDNIVMPYQPPLALVSAKWVDKNQSGAVDFQNVNDELHLSFSRQFNAGVTGTTLDAISGAIWRDSLAASPLNGIVLVSPTIVANRILVYKVSTNNAFVPGQTYLVVSDAQKVIYDRASPENYCISSQNVKILPQ